MVPENLVHPLCHQVRIMIEFSLTMRRTTGILRDFHPFFYIKYDSCFKPLSTYCPAIVNIYHLLFIER